MPDLNPQQFGQDYRGQHQPPPDGAPLHDLTSGDSGMPGDVYTHPHYYTHTGTSERYDRDSIREVKASRGKPERAVTVYRAAPHGVTHINPGDWVSLSHDYAKQHARHPTDPSQDMPVHSARVPAKHVTNGGNDIVEWAYSGPHPKASTAR